MDRLLKGGRLPSMKRALTLIAVEAGTEEAVETDAAGGDTNEKGHIRYEHLPFQIKSVFLGLFDF